MPVPRAPQVALAADEQSRLESIVRAHSTPQALSFRCQLILRAAAADCPSNLQVAFLTADVAQRFPSTN